MGSRDLPVCEFTPECRKAHLHAFRILPIQCRSQAYPSFVIIWKKRYFIVLVWQSIFSFNCFSRTDMVYCELSLLPWMELLRLTELLVSDQPWIESLVCWVSSISLILPNLRTPNSDKARVGLISTHAVISHYHPDPWQWFFTLLQVNQEEFSALRIWTAVHRGTQGCKILQLPSWPPTLGLWANRYHKLLCALGHGWEK